LLFTKNTPLKIIHHYVIHYNVFQIYVKITLTSQMWS